MLELASVEFWQMWVVLAGVVISIIFYCWDRFAIEVVSASIVVSLMAFFQFFPLETGNPSATQLLAGFANPALITILALLIVGQGIFQTGAMDGPTRLLLDSYETHPRTTLLTMFGFVFAVSAFINNTPVVVMFVPILVAIAKRMEQSPSKLMIPLSYVCILAGMTTLIGSSTNLLVADSLFMTTGQTLGFFAPSSIGIILAAVGLVYIMTILPRLLPERAGMEESLRGADGRQYIAQLEITPGHPLDGKQPVAGMFPDLPDMTVRMIQRGEHALLPPFFEITLKPGDLVIVAATRKKLQDLLSQNADIVKGLIESSDMASDSDGGDQLGITEAVVAPGSRLIGRTIEQIGFRHTTGCVVLGIQRRSRMIRSRMGEIRLESGDTLLLFGSSQAMRRLRTDRDLLLLEWSKSSIADPRKTLAARIIFGAVVFLAATGIAPIVLASFLGAVAMLGTGCLNTRQAARAVDIRIYLLIGSAFALGSALQVTGGANLLASGVVAAFAPFGPVVLLSALFILVAALTNVLSNSATAILFTPIAVGAAEQLNQDPTLFALTVLFAANTCFATPIGYQTNLLVMGPGHYKFGDYLKAGTPLVIVIWLAFTGYLALRDAVGWM